MQYVFVFILGIAAGLYFWPKGDESVKEVQKVEQTQTTSPGQKIDQIINIIKE